MSEPTSSSASPNNPTGPSGGTYSSAYDTLYLHCHAIPIFGFYKHSKLHNSPPSVEYTIHYSLYPYEHSSLFPMVCRNMCLRVYPKMVVGQLHYSVGKKYCRRCECYFITPKVFCECSGIQLRANPHCGKNIQGKSQG
jgi:hypothetical protein